MKKKLKGIYFKRGFFLVLISILSSCVYHKNTLLLKEENDKPVNKYHFSEIDSTEYELQIGDLLNIRISSPDQESVAQFQLNQASGSTNSGASPLSSYQVDKQGNITLPLIGEVYVQGLTLVGVKNKLKKELGQYFKYLTINLQLVSFKVTFLGEVGNPSTFNISIDRTNFFEALSKVGGTTDFANTKKVKIVRKTETEADVILLDISEASFLESKYFFLRPNDVVYIPPLRSKANRANLNLLTTAASLTSLIILIFTRINN